MMNIFLFGLLAAVSFIFIIPVLYCIFNSVKTSSEILRQVTFLPRNITWENYEYVFERGSKYLNYYWNTIAITASGVLITVLFSAMAGYAFAKLPFRGSNSIMGFILFIVTFPLAALLIPTYMMEFKLGLLNTHLGLILPNVMNVLPFSVFIMRGVFMDIPDELSESAEIDGCSVFRTWWNIMLPMARNGLIIVTVFAFYSIWGEYTMGKALATQDASMPISVALTLLKGDNWNYGVLGSVITMAIIPPIAVFAVFQKEMVKGMVQGAIKG
jgi:ABC-type glycerol-3-phosphate transport system permease component